MLVPEIYQPLQLAGTLPLAVIARVFMEPVAVNDELATGERIKSPETVDALLPERVKVLVPCPEDTVVAAVIPVPETYHPLQLEGVAVAKVTVFAPETPLTAESVMAAEGRFGLEAEAVPMS